MNEIRPIAGLPGYGIDVQGQPYSYWTGRGNNARIGGVPYPLRLSKSKSHARYPAVLLSKGGKKSVFRLHRLVLEAFVGPRPPGLECRHLDGDESNPALYDRDGNRRLVWGTRQENEADRVRHGTSPAKLSPSDIPAIRLLLARGESKRELGRRYGVSAACIRNIEVGRTWSHVP
jgi:hypothetical protein